MQSITAMPKTGDVSLAASTALLPGPTWRSARNRVRTPKSQEAPKTGWDQVPSEFPCLKHHRPAQNPQSAQGYHVSCSTEIGGGPEEAKPFI